MANKYYIVPNVRTKSASIKESSGIEFLCPSNTVMTGRYHKGDENGQTQYKIGRITFNGKTTSVINAASLVSYQEYQESAGVFFKTESYLLYYGRYHKGDENGLTYNYQAIVKCSK